MAWGGVDRVLSTEKAHRQLDDHELGDGDVHRRVVERRRGDDDRNSVGARGHVGRDDGAGVPEGPAPRADAVQVGLEGGERRRGPRAAVDGAGAVRDARPLLRGAAASRTSAPAARSPTSAFLAAMLSA